MSTGKKGLLGICLYLLIAYGTSLYFSYKYPPDYGRWDTVYMELCAGFFWPLSVPMEGIARFGGKWVPTESPQGS